jgi:hypothetical protein
MPLSWKLFLISHPESVGATTFARRRLVKSSQLLSFGKAVGYESSY